MKHLHLFKSYRRGALDQVKEHFQGNEVPAYVKGDGPAAEGYMRAIFKMFNMRSRICILHTLLIHTGQTEQNLSSHCLLHYCFTLLSYKAHVLGHWARLKELIVVFNPAMMVNTNTCGWFGRVLIIVGICVVVYLKRLMMRLR